MRVVTVEDDGLPDVAVVDVRLPPTYRDGGRAAVEALRRHPGLPVPALSAHVPAYLEGSAR